jgi:hypothetical protein
MESEVAAEVEAAWAHAATTTSLPRSDVYILGLKTETKNTFTSYGGGSLVAYDEYSTEGAFCHAGR